MATGNVFGYGFMIVFGVFWTLMVMSAPPPVNYFFPLFGFLFIAIGVYRLYVEVRRSGRRQSGQQAQTPIEMPKPPSDDGMSAGYCPYCGAPLSPGFVFCGVCGRRLRWSPGPDATSARSSS